MRVFRLSLRGRVVASGTAVVVVLVLALDVFVYFSLRDQLLSTLERVLDAREQLVVGLREDHPPEELGDRLEEAGVRAVIRTADGQTLSTRDAPDVFTLPPSVSDEPLVSRTVPLPDGAVAIVLASRAGVDATMDQVLVLAATGSVVVAGLAYGLFWWLGARVLHPVRHVARTARHIGEGRRDERLAPRDDDPELQEMVDAFNGMLDALETALERSQQAESISRRFLADAAHQLRTPVAGIRASVGALLRAEDAHERELLIDNLAQETARMSHLLSSLLRMARLDTHEMSDRTHVRLATLLEEVVARQEIRAPQLRFTLHAAGDLAVSVNADSLREALVNVLDNASRHAVAQVDVRATMADAQVAVRIVDDGPGIAADDRERVFERFVSLDDAGGSGLGLAIARGITEAHGGTLGYTAGAFEFRLPVSDAADAESSLSVDPAAPSPR